MRDPVETIDRFLTAYWSGDAAATLALITDDFEWINMPLPGLKRQGRAVMAQLMAGKRGSWPEEPEAGEHVALRATVDGDIVMHERLDRFEFKRGWVELPCNGVWTVRDGRIREWKDYFDLATYIRGMASVGFDVGHDLERYY